LFQNVPGVYTIANVAKIAKPFNIAYRGPQRGNVMYQYLSLLDDVAGYLDKRFTDIAYLNAPQAKWLSRSNQVPNGTDRFEWKIMMDRLESSYNYTTKVAECDAFNATNKYVKRAVEVSYGQYETAVNAPQGNYDVTLKITPNGEVLIYTSQCEIGQGSYSKVLSLVASKLKCPPSLIRVIETNSNINAWPDGGGAGSRGTQEMLSSAEDACNRFLSKYAYFLTGAANGDLYAHNLANTTTNNFGVFIRDPAQYNLSFSMTGNGGLGDPANWKRFILAISTSFPYVETGPVVTTSYPSGSTPSNTQWIYPSMTGGAVIKMTQVNDLLFQGNSVNLNPNGVQLPNTGSNYVQYYRMYVASMSTVEVNILTGNVRILETNLIGDFGNSINPSIDQGQLYGGYIWSLGACFKEERTYNSNRQMLITDTWDYKPPCVVDIPELFTVDMYGNTGAYGDLGARLVMDSKGLTEVVSQAAQSSFFAAKSAVRAFRKQQGLPLRFNLMMPATPDRLQAAAGLSSTMITM